MNPNETKIEELERKIRDLESLVNDLQRVNLINPEFKQVLDRSVVSSSGKTVASETQAVDEGGAATYNVQKVPDTYITIGGYHIAAWNS